MLVFGENAFFLKETWFFPGATDFELARVAVREYQSALTLLHIEDGFACTVIDHTIPPFITIGANDQSYLTGFADLLIAGGIAYSYHS